jgi:thioredoxin reductase
MELHAVVVGAGPAGLAAALTFGRMRRRVLVLDTGEPRNRHTEHLHNFPTRDGIAPAEYRALARMELGRYPTVSFRDDRVVRAEVGDGLVTIGLESAEALDARRVVLAGGIRDTLPPIEGLAALFGRSVFTCPYCDGYEAEGAPVGLICTAPGQVAHAAGLLRMLGDDVTVFANGVAVSVEERSGADRLGVRVVTEHVARLRDDGEHVVVLLAGGGEARCDRLFVPTEVHPSNRLAEQLGCATNADGFIEVDELGRTSVARVYAAGDAVSPVHQVVVAAASGTRAALAANHDAIEAFELA